MSAAPRGDGRSGKGRAPGNGRQPGLGSPGLPIGPIAAVLVPKGRALAARPLFERGVALQLKQDRKRSDGRELRPGELVIVEPAGITRGKRHGRLMTEPVVQVIRRIGSAAVTRDVLEALMIERGLGRRFDARVDRYAAQAATAPDPFARRDLTELPTFTMDPEGAKDFDDAISARAEDDGTRIWVHIADVSSFVRPGDPVDEEAYRRSTSVYVPGAVEPMLPAALSNDACSLVPGEPRRAVTAELLFSGDEITAAAFYRSTIRSDARLGYGEVDAIFAGRAEAREPWAQSLALARTVSSRLETARTARKALEVHSSEPIFEFDKRGDADSVRVEEQTESHKVIEHLMIAANEQVARYLDTHHHPSLYRVHEKPDPESVEALVEQLASLGVPTPPMPDHFTPRQAEELVGEISIRVAAHVRREGAGSRALNGLVLRALKQAVYSPRNLGHSGLRSSHYTHFTSPIRRYPDLIVHRALLAALGVDDAGPEAKDLGDAAEWTSGRERDAMKIERAADDICRAFLLERLLREQGWSPPEGPQPQRPGGPKRPANRRPPKRPDRAELRAVAAGGPVFGGEVTGMIGGGLFVAFGPEFAFEGFLPLREIKEHRGGYWNVNGPQTALVDEESGYAIKLGQSVEVAVIGVEPARARVDLLPVRV
ncbi:MAG: RNB domain-containing ribonuclease [Solirubrobacterales bacterium]